MNERYGDEIALDIGAQEQQLPATGVNRNRKNAMRSTGPTTRAGKRAAKWNALKHGLLAKEVVIEQGDGKESKTEFRALLQALIDDLRPEGVLEEMLVERIATSYWRLRRVLKAEVGEIGRELDTVGWRDVFARRDTFQQHVRMPTIFRDELQKTTLDLDHLIGVLDQVRTNVEEVGYLAVDANKELRTYFGTEEHGFWEWCFLFSHMAERGGGPGDDGEWIDAERCKQMLLTLLECEKDRLTIIRDSLEEKEQLELRAKVASLLLPNDGATNKLLRYETTIERQLYRAMHQLERLQRQRAGEMLPPPIQIELDGKM